MVFFFLEISFLKKRGRLDFKIVLGRELPRDDFDEPKSPRDDFKIAPDDFEIQKIPNGPVLVVHGAKYRQNRRLPGASSALSPTGIDWRPCDVCGGRYRRACFFFTHFMIIYYPLHYYYYY